MILRLAAFLLLTLASNVWAADAMPPRAADATRVVVLVLDQLRPDYLDRFQLPHLRALRDRNRHFPNAHVGHFPAITLISHPVIGTGVFPRRFGWSDELWRDTDGHVGPVGAWHLVGKLSLPQFRAILDVQLPRPTALTQLRERLGGPVITIGQKDYAAITIGGLDADRVITLTSAQKDGPWRGWCRPTGHRIPAYIAGPRGGRFWLDCRHKFGSEQLLYSLDARYVPGDDPAHQGGDVWTADAALAVMDREPAWRVLLLTMGGIDRVAHALGEADQATHRRAAREFPFRLETALRVADDQVGRLVAALQARGLWERTHFIVTSDHGGLSADRHFYGNRARTPHLDNGVVGTTVESPDSVPSQRAAQWMRPEIVDHATLDTAVRIWLTMAARATIDTHCRHFARMPGAIGGFRKMAEGPRWRYQRCAGRSSPRPAWLRAEPLLDTMAAADSPDLVIELRDATSYQLLGDHGGLQEPSLRIPLFWHRPSGDRGVSSCPVRLVDLMPLLFRELGMTPPAWFDGDDRCRPD